MEETTKQHVSPNGSKTKPRRKCFSSTDESGDEEIVELTNYKNSTYVCISFENADVSKEDQLNSLDGCKPSSHLIKTAVDPKMQAIAQLFVDELLLRASEEASYRISTPSQCFVHKREKTNASEFQYEAREAATFNIDQEGVQSESQSRSVPVSVRIIRDLLQRRCQRAYGLLANCFGKLP